MVDLRFDCVDIFLRNRHRFPGGVVLTCVNIDLTPGDTVEFVADRSLGAVADRHNHDNGGDADNNAQHRQNRPALVGPDILDRHLYIFK